MTVTGDEDVTQTTIRPDGDDRLDRAIDDELLDLATRARVIAAGGTIRIERNASDAPEVVIRFPAPLRL